VPDKSKGRSQTKCSLWRPRSTLGYSLSRVGEEDSYRSPVVKKRNLGGCNGLFKQHSEALDAYVMLVCRSLERKNNMHLEGLERDGRVILRWILTEMTYENGRWMELTQDFVQWRISV
jgi:hypothetical protein